MKRKERWSWYRGNSTRYQIQCRKYGFVQCTKYKVQCRKYEVRGTELKISNAERRTPNVELKHPITRMPYLVLACLPQAGYNILDTWYSCLNPTPSKNPSKNGRTNWIPYPTRYCAKKEQKDPSPVPIRSIRKQASTPAKAVATPFSTRISSTTAAAVGQVSPSPSVQKPLRCTWTIATWWFEKKSFVHLVEDT